jgi:hypothetical protein
MVLGGVWCPIDKKREIFSRIREIKVKHNLAPWHEIKWTKVSPAKLGFYLDLVDYFFDNDDLHFRSLVVPDKSALRHADFGQDHDKWYYKMYFQMLSVIFDPKSKYRIYIDIKDTRGGQKIAQLHEVLCNNLYDFHRHIVERVQLVESKQIELLQLADLLIGAVSWVNRDKHESSAKQAIVNRIKERTGYSLKKSTLYREKKFNIFIWQCQEK